MEVRPSGRTSFLFLAFFVSRRFDLTKTRKTACICCFHLADVLCYVCVWSYASKLSFCIRFAQLLRSKQRTLEVLRRFAQHFATFGSAVLAAPQHNASKFSFCTRFAQHFNKKSKIFNKKCQFLYESSVKCL